MFELKPRSKLRNTLINQHVIRNLTQGNTIQINCSSSFCALSLGVYKQNDRQQNELQPDASGIIPTTTTTLRPEPTARGGVSGTPRGRILPSIPTTACGGLHATADYSICLPGKDSGATGPRNGRGLLSVSWLLGFVVLLSHEQLRCQKNNYQDIYRFHLRFFCVQTMYMKRIG